MNLENAIKEASKKLKNNKIISHELDAQIILADIMGIKREFLITNDKINISKGVLEKYNIAIKRRINNEPIAYIIGKKEFWSQDFFTNRSTLVPRPETEILIEDILLNFNQTNLSVLDLGTGSGAIGLSLKKEKKEWDVYCSDISINALEVANKNSLKNNLEVNFICCDWLNAFKPNSFDLLISNPPYIKTNDIRLKSDGLSYEPLEALVSGTDRKSVV